MNERERRRVAEPEGGEDNTRNGVRYFTSFSNDLDLPFAVRNQANEVLALFYDRDDAEAFRATKDLNDEGD